MGIVGHPAGWGVGSVDEFVGSKFKGVTPLNLLDNSSLFFTLLQFYSLMFFVQELSEKIPFPGPIMDWKTLSRVTKWTNFKTSKNLSSVYPLGASHPQRRRVCSRQGIWCVGALKLDRYVIELIYCIRIFFEAIINKIWLNGIKMCQCCFQVIRWLASPRCLAGPSSPSSSSQPPSSTRQGEYLDQNRRF